MNSFVLLWPKLFSGDLHAHRLKSQTIGRLISNGWGCGEGDLEGNGGGSGIGFRAHAGEGTGYGYINQGKGDGNGRGQGMFCGFKDGNGGKDV